MAEWSIAAVLKTVELRGSGGSNPSLSAKKKGVPKGAPFLFCEKERAFSHPRTGALISTELVSNDTRKKCASESLSLRDTKRRTSPIGLVFCVALNACGKEHQSFCKQNTTLFAHIHFFLYFCSSFITHFNILSS